jgi:hypothetical protein
MAPSVRSIPIGRRRPRQPVNGLKMPGISRFATLTTPKAAQETVDTLLSLWDVATPLGREILKQHGQAILQGVASIMETT